MKFFSKLSALKAAIVSACARSRTTFFDSTPFLARVGILSSVLLQLKGRLKKLTSISFIRVTRSVTNVREGRHDELTKVGAARHHHCLVLVCGRRNAGNPDPLKSIGVRFEGLTGESRISMREGLNCCQCAVIRRAYLAQERVKVAASATKVVLLQLGIGIL